MSTSSSSYRELRDDGVNDPFVLLETLNAYASDKHYFAKVKKIIIKIREDYKNNYRK